jgi:hypothetical protein
MKRHLRKCAAVLVATFLLMVTPTIVRAFPNGWLLPFYNDGRAMISSNGQLGIN